MFLPSLNSCIEKLHFHPKEGEAQGSLRYFESGSKCTANSLESHDQGNLDPSNVEAWLTKTHVLTSDDAAKEDGHLRLILVGRTKHSKHFNHLPCSEATFRVILEGCRFSNGYAACLVNEGARLFWDEIIAPNKDISLSFTSKTFAYRVGSHAMSLTYDFSTNTTSAIIQGGRDTSTMARMIAMLEDKADFADHPGLLPLIAAYLVWETSHEEYHSLRMEMERLESLTGHGNLITPIRTKNPLNLYEQDLYGMAWEFSIFSSRVASKIERARQMLLRIPTLLEFIKRFDEIMSENHDGAPATANKGIYNASPAHQVDALRKSENLRRQANGLANNWQCQIQRYESFEKNVQVQLTVIYNATVQRDSRLNLQIARLSANIAAETKRDSSIVKSIALLTILFLPATFVSTLFAMPLFDWNADHLSSVAGPYAWIYAAVALPLTIAVVVVWLIWMNFARLWRRSDSGNGLQRIISGSSIDEEQAFDGNIIIDDFKKQ